MVVAANQLNKNNLGAFFESLTKHNKTADLWFESFEDSLNRQVNKSIEENALAFKRIFYSSIPSLVHIRLHTPSQKRENIENISLKFSSLEKESDILSFAGSYGLLGVLDWGWNNYYYTYFETLNTWHTYIEHVKRLIKLYKALRDKKRGKDIEVIGEFFSLTEVEGYTIGKGLDKMTNIDWTEKYRITESKNQSLASVNRIPFPVPILSREIEESQEYDGLIGSYILARLIKAGLDGAVKISFSEVFPSDLSSIGFSFNETYSSSCLLGAIYQDLWRLITTDTPIRYCSYCNRPIVEKGKKRHCNDSCRQMAYKERKKKVNN